jgi:hypothetical protein
MKTPQPSSFFGKLQHPGITYGLGLDFTSFPQYSKQGLTVLGKSGGTGNYNSMVFTIPDKRITVAVIGTGPSAGSMDIALKVLDAYLAEKGLITNTPVKPKLPLQSEPIPAEFFSYAGYYAADGGSIFKLIFDTEKNSLTVFNTEGNSEKLTLSAIFNKGFFHDSSGGKYYFINIEGANLIINASLVDIIKFQRIEPLINPGKLKLDLTGTVWLRRNVEPYEARMSVDNHLVKPHQLTALPGYVDFLGIKKIDSLESAGISLKTVRDASELQFFDRAGETWAWVSGMTYMPEKLAKNLTSGTTSVTIIEKGVNEWFKTEKDTLLSFSKPENSRIILISPEDTILYDSVVDNGEVFAPAGSWLELAGTAGNVIVVGSTFGLK